MSVEKLLAEGVPTVAGASRVIIRFAELFSNSPKTISTMASLQRNLRDTDRTLLKEASVKHGRKDGNMYIDMTLPMQDKQEALTFAVHSTTNAVVKSMVHLDRIEEVHVIEPLPELDTPYAWTKARENPSTSATEAARVIMQRYQQALFPADVDITVDPALEALYQYQ